MSEFYFPIKHLHLTLVAISLVFFMARGTAIIVKAQWVTQKWARISPHIIDTFLLISGIFLTFIISQYPIMHDWLTSKMILLVGYIMFGMKAMKSEVPMKQRSYFAAAIACVLLMITVATTHHPLGMFSLM